MLGPDGAMLSRPTAAVGIPAPAVSGPDSVLPMTSTNLEVIRAAAKKSAK